MAIDFKLLPDEIHLKKPFPWWGWGIVLLIFMLVGLIVVILLQLDSQLELRDVIMWGMIFPFISWLLVVFCWIFVRGFKEVYTERCNKLRQERKEMLIAYGQRPLYIIHNEINSEFGVLQHAVKLTEQLVALEARIPYKGGNPIFHSRLPLPINISPNQFEERIKLIFDHLKSTSSMFLTTPFEIFPFHVRLFVDVPISSENIEKMWNDIIENTENFASWQIIDPRQGTTFLDSWLDNSEHDDELLWCISLHLFEHPKPYYSEVMTSLICLGGNIIKNQNIIKYITMNKIELVSLHRTEEGDDLANVLEHAQIWGKADNTELFSSLWLNQLSPDNHVNLLAKYGEQQVLMEHIYDIDRLFGIAGNNNYWLSLALAAEYCNEAKNKQLIVGQEGNRFNATIVAKL